MTGYYSKRGRSFRALSLIIGLAGSLVGFLLLPCPVRADDTEDDTEVVTEVVEPEPITWARIDFLRNQVQLLPSGEGEARRARISDVLNYGDALRTLRRSRAELRFNDDSLARIGERATFQFTPNTRNFQLTNGTALLLIPPGRGRSTIQTPNAVTGIQGSALFVRYIPETDTTIVGALTDNPNGPMILFNRDGSEQQALQANEIGVIEGDQITQLYRFDSLLFWQSSGLAEGLNFLEESGSDDSDPLSGVGDEIREAIAKQEPLPSEGEGIIENPASFTRPDPVEASPTDTDTDGPTPANTGGTPATGTSTGGTGSNSSGGTGNSSPSPDTAQSGNGTGSGTGTGTGANTGSTPSTETPPTPEPTTGGTSSTSPLTPVTPPSGGSASTGAEAIQEPVRLEYRGTPAEAYLTGTPINSRPLTESVIGNDATKVPHSTSTTAGSGSAAGSGSTTGGSTTGGSTTGGSTTGGSTAGGNSPSTPINDPLLLPVNPTSGTPTGNPLPPRDTPTTTNTTSAAPSNTPALNPSTSLTPIDRRPLTENLPSQTPSSGTPPSTPTGAPTPSSTPSNSTPSNSAPSNSAPSNGNPTTTPSTVIIPETVATPSTATPVNTPAVNNPATNVPLEPEIGGTSLEGVLEPTKVPTDSTGENPSSENPPQNGTNPPSQGNSGSGTPAQGGGTNGSGGGRVLL